MQNDTVPGNLESLRHARKEALNDRCNLPAKDAFVRAGETSIAQESCAAGKYLFIRSLDVSVRADHGADLSVEHPGKSDFLRRRFSVEINEDEFRLLADFF